MPAAELPNLFGCSAGMTADQGSPSGLERLAARQRHTSRPRRGPVATIAYVEGDALPPRLCPRCRMKGEHADAGQCIDELRSRLADLE